MLSSTQVLVTRRPRRALAFAACAALLAVGTILLSATSLDAAEADEVRFSEAEIAAILSHGPWPMPWTPDPSNRASGNAVAVDLGEQFFFDKRLSIDGTIACATCHEFDQRWIDRRARAVGRQPLDRNTPHLNNVLLHRWFG